MSISFTQYLLPKGEKRAVEIDMPDDIEKLASEFIEAGGYFECEMLSTGHVSLTACWNKEDGDNDISIQVLINGPAVVDAVETIVRDAHRQLKAGILKSS